MAEFSLLPPIDESKYMQLPHFPTRLHAAVFRMWETVKAECIAYGLDMPLETIHKIASAMGLPKQRNMDIWEKRGFLTTIRNAWHILPYDALLRVLNMTESELAAVLKDEDFFGYKLGDFKPRCEKIVEEPLSEAQEKQLAHIREVMEKEFSDMFLGKEPFVFFDDDGEEINVVETDGIRMVFSYCGLYAKALDEDIRMSYPEAILKKYVKMGINAIWLPVVLYQVTPFPFDEEYSQDYEMRQRRLRELVALAGKYGIKVYLYLNEPRCMPFEFFEKYPELMGHKTEFYGALCTSNRSVIDYLDGAVTALCEAVPGLGGFFLITASENLTNCKYKPNTNCEKCKDRAAKDIISEVICTIANAAKRVDEKIRTIAWDWAWDSIMTKEEQEECVSALPKDVIIQSTSEYKLKYKVGGICGEVDDYTMSIPGPGERARGVWSKVQSLGHEVCAKVQINNTWECSTVAFLPVFNLIREHMVNLKNEGVKHLMLSWTLGGCPSINFKVATECFKNPSEDEYYKLLEEEYGKDADVIKRAAEKFSEAFREFPFQLDTVYLGPHNSGPSNLLHLKPSGFKPTMTCYAYDDLDEWRTIYPREIFREQFRKLSDKWREGLAELDAMEDNEFKQAAYTGYALFYSSYLQIDFLMNRDNGNNNAMLEIAKKERKVAYDTYQLMLKNATIGYEAANHYYFNKGMLAEKVLNCDYIIKTLS